jgi:hypothetical protein
MKSHFAAEFEDASTFNQTADEQVWRQHRLPPTSRRDNAIVLAVLASLFVLSQAASPPSSVVAPVLAPPVLAPQVSAASMSGWQTSDRPAWLDKGTVAGFNSRQPAATIEYGDDRDRTR